MYKRKRKSSKRRVQVQHKHSKGMAKAWIVLVECMWSALECSRVQKKHKNMTNLLFYVSNSRKVWQVAQKKNNDVFFKENENVEK